jgi:hypothetical protein
MLVAPKVTGSSFTAAEFEQGNNELENFIEDTNQTLSAADLTQVAKSVANYVASGDFYTASGAPNAYTLDVPVASGWSKKKPTEYHQGMRIRFRADTGDSNTGPSTINVVSLGTKNILQEDGSSALIGGEILDTQDIELRYDTAADAAAGAFILVNLPAAQATTTIKGTAALSGGMVLGTNCQIARNSGDSQNIDFSASVWNFDDGTGQAVITSALEKRLDATFVAGDTNGMLDTGSIAADTPYHLFHIYNPTSGVSDYLASTSFSAPTLPSGYTKKQFIETILTDAGTPDIRLFIHSGDTMCHVA